MPIPILRVARPSDDIDALLPFYRDGLGLTVLYRFADHDGFDGVMLGHERRRIISSSPAPTAIAPGRAPTQDNLVVFYLPDAAEWRAAVERMKAAGFAAVPAFNPYWDREGLTFEDPDGYRIVLQRAAWTR